MLLSRSTAGPEMTRAPVDLEPLVLDVLDVAARLAQGTGVSLRVEDAAPAIVRGDADAIGRALLNLVENAVKYTPAGEGGDLARRGGR